MPTAKRQPHIVVGAGDLVSFVSRRPEYRESMRYAFNIFRMQPGGQVTQSFRPVDLHDIVKACQVLAFSIADDGWLPRDVRKELFDLADAIDTVTQNRGE